MTKKSVTVEKTDDNEVILNITQTASDDYSLVFTSTALYLFQDDEEIVDNVETASQKSQEILLMNIFDELNKNTRFSSCKYKNMRSLNYKNGSHPYINGSNHFS